VELARWFDSLFSPLDKKRTYARPSRRQSSTPDIPRPNWILSQAALDGRTFGVVLGRGGTVLQPGIDMLVRAKDFPKDAPILVITDGYCDKVILYGREHAFWVPVGANLPFVPNGKVFRMR